MDDGDNLIAEGKTKPFIIVMEFGGNPFGVRRAHKRRRNWRGGGRCDQCHGRSGQPPRF
jgi:hypothetical protein